MSSGSETSTHSEEIEIDGVSLESLEVKEEEEESISVAEDAIVRPPLYIQPFCVFLGAAAFMGLTSLINAIDYFNTIFPGNKALSGNVSRIVNFCSFAALVISFPFVEKIPAVVRFTVAQAVASLCFLFYMIYPNVTKNPSVIAMYIVFGIQGVFFGILMGTTNGFCGLLGKYGGSLAIVGNAGAGLISTVLRLISKTVGSSGQGYFYFGCDFLITTLALVLFLLFQKTEYCIFCKKFAKKGMDACTRLKRIGHVLKKIWIECAQALLCQVITYTLFPGYATQTEIVHGLERSWVTLLITCLYMIGDFSGRMLARFWKWPKPRFVWMCSVIRLLFFPLYVISIQRLGIVDEIWIYILSFFLSFSGGYFITISVQYTTSNPKLEMNEMEIAAFTVTFFTGVGVTIGCLISFAMPTI